MLPWESFGPDGRPLTFRIIDDVYTIRWTDELWTRATNCDGWVTYQPPVICVSTHLSPMRLAQVFTHEIVHAILKALDPDKTTYTIEEVCHAASFLATVWMDNPDVFRWLEGVLATARTPLVHPR